MLFNSEFICTLTLCIRNCFTGSMLAKGHGHLAKPVVWAPTHSGTACGAALRAGRGEALEAALQAAQTDHGETGRPPSVPLSSPRGRTPTGPRAQATIAAITAHASAGPPRSRPAPPPRGTWQVRTLPAVPDASPRRGFSRRDERRIDTPCGGWSPLCTSRPTLRPVTAPRAPPPAGSRGHASR